MKTIYSISKFTNQIDKSFSSLKVYVGLIEIFIVLISCLIISFTVINASILYVKGIVNNDSNLQAIKLQVLNQVSFTLSFILAIEILKIFYIKNYKQLIIVSSLGFLKIVLSFFISYEKKDQIKK